jgi:hypothetical protein
MNWMNFVVGESLFSHLRDFTFARRLCQFEGLFFPFRKGCISLQSASIASQHNHKVFAGHCTFRSLSESFPRSSGSWDVHTKFGRTKTSRTSLIALPRHQIIELDCVMTASSGNRLFTSAVVDFRGREAPYRSSDWALWEEQRGQQGSVIDIVMAPSSRFRPCGPN